MVSAVPLGRADQQLVHLAPALRVPGGGVGGLHGLHGEALEQLLHLPALDGILRCEVALAGGIRWSYCFVMKPSFRDRLHYAWERSPRLVSWKSLAGAAAGIGTATLLLSGRSDAWEQLTLVIGTELGGALGGFLLVPVPVLLWHFITAHLGIQASESARMVKENVELRQRIAKLSESRPAINVKTINHGEWWGLEVTNHGASAVFKGQIEFLSGKPDGAQQQVTGYWDESDRKPQMEILSGQKQRLAIGKRQGTSNEVYYFRPSSTPSIVSSDQAFTIRVTISSNPAPIDGPYVGTYILDHTGLHDIPNVAYPD